MSPEAGVIEHVFVLVFAVAYPVLGFFSFRRLLRRIAAGSPADRPRLYRHTIVGHWILLGTGLYLWWSAGRPLEELGFTTETGVGFMTALAFTVAGIVFLVGQVRSATGGDREFLDAVADAFGPLVHLLPRSRRELRTFYLVGITAGIAEEVLWRGYLLAYLSTWLPVPVSAAIVVAGFGLAHAYQGARSVPRVTVVGAVFTALDR